MTFFVYFAIFTFALSFLANQIYKIVPEPFMDEIFHIRQAQEYFHGNYNKWDPMITTPPGLYVISIGLLKLLRLPDTVTSFRAINVLFGVGIILVSRAICRRVPFSNERALLIASLPNLFIFYGLYYTDAGSVLFVLLAQMALIKRLHLLFLLCAILSLTFRQTNIVWVAGFCIADQIYIRVKGDLLHLWREKASFKLEMSLMSLLIGIFAGFFCLNGGSVALGDKESHTVSLHLAQFFYCTTTIFAFCWPLILHKNALKSIKRFLCVFLISLPLAYCAVRSGTIVHPYLLADNRHWTNFIWRRFLKFEPARYALIPLHALSTTLIFESLMDRGFIWVLGYFSACAMVLIPSPLIEPRYYILPLVFFLLNCKISSRKQAALQIFVFILLNSFIVGYFLYKPFIWPHVPNELQRRIW